MKAKWCWVATQTRRGWRLKLSVGPKDYPIRGLLVKDANKVRRITGGEGGVVYVHLKDAKP